MRGNDLPFSTRPVRDHCTSRAPSVYSFAPPICSAIGWMRRALLDQQDELGGLQNAAAPEVGASV